MTDTHHRMGHSIDRSGDRSAVKVIIVGGGPAGLATALHLARIAPALADDILIIEAKEHPRDKLCGGAVTFHGETQLHKLGVVIDAPAFHVQRIAFRLGPHTFTARSPNAMRVFERAAFDAALAKAAQDQGLRLHSNERVLDLRVTDDSVAVRTTAGSYRAEVVVGADGANSISRRKLGFAGGRANGRVNRPANDHANHHALNGHGVARLLRVMTPIDPRAHPAWQTQTAQFDFSPIRQGIQGYVWDFPCYSCGQATMNRGIFDSRLHPVPFGEREHGLLKQTFAAALRARQVDLEAVQLEGHPVRWFDPRAEFSRPRALLVGDAAGVDPLFAEGISYALEYGMIAAEAISEAFTRRDFSFATYRDRLLRAKLGRSLRRRTWVAAHLYQHRVPSFWTLLWGAAAIAPEGARRAVGAALDVLPFRQPEFLDRPLNPDI